jgi:hypothetical protein
MPNLSKIFDLGSTALAFLPDGRSMSQLSDMVTLCAKLKLSIQAYFPRMQWEIVIDSFLEHLRDPVWSLEHLQYGRLIHSFANKQESLQPGFFFF